MTKNGNFWCIGPQNLHIHDKSFPLTPKTSLYNDFFESRSSSQIQKFSEKRLLFGRLWSYRKVMGTVGKLTSRAFQKCRRLRRSSAFLRRKRRLKRFLHDPLPRITILFLKSRSSSQKNFQTPISAQKRRATAQTTALSESSWRQLSNGTHNFSVASETAERRTFFWQFFDHVFFFLCLMQTLWTRINYVYTNPIKALKIEQELDLRNLRIGYWNISGCLRILI